ncbi:MAG: phosphoribosylglycinamide formyltransferase [Alphaproteobacteria bacterium]|nr:MAG: phosphoribosylglycinamide formyltransferase [Alphaproteobacteria bacterium]
MTQKARTAVFISGNGSNLQALMDATRNDTSFPAEIVLVLSNKADAYGLTRAHEAGIATIVVSHKDYPNRTAFDDAMHQIMKEHEIELICLAGFMRLLTPDFTQKWAGRMINIHPSLLPDYKGLDTHRRVLEDGCHETGCTVHYVIADMDAGEIIMQERVPILAGDTVEALQQRVHAAEHRIYPYALKEVAEKLLG